MVLHEKLWFDHLSHCAAPGGDSSPLATALSNSQADGCCIYMEHCDSSWRTVRRVPKNIYWLFPKSFPI